MSEKFRINCPNCGHPLRVRKEHIGKKGTCAECAHQFPIELPDDDKGDTSYDIPAAVEVANDELWGGPKPEPPPPKPELPVLPDEPTAAAGVDFGASEALERLERENAAIRAELEELKPKYEALQRLERENAATRTELDELKPKYEALQRGERESAAIRTELDGVKTKYEALVRVDQESAVIRTELDELKAKYERRRAALADALGKVDRREKTIAQLKAELEAASVDRDRFSEGHAEAVRLRVELDDMKASLAGNIAELGQKFHDSKLGWEAEKELLISEWTARCDEVRTTASGHRDESATLRNQFVESEAERDSERAAALAERTSLQDELANARAEIERREREHAEAIEASAAAARAKDEDHADTLEACAVAARAKDEEHAAERERWEACRASWTAERETLIAASGEGSEAARRAAELEEQLREASERAQRLSDNDGQHATTRESMENDLAALRARIAEMTRELKRSADLRDEMIRFLAGLGITFPT